jgi:hypothetical protein
MTAGPSLLEKGRPRANGYEYTSRPIAERHKARAVILSVGGRAVDALIGAVLGDRGCNPDASEIVLAGIIARPRVCAEMEKPPAAEAARQELARPLLLFRAE